MRVLSLGIAVLLAATGCARGEEKPDTPVVTTTTGADRAVGAAAVANAIAERPSAADSILKAAGYTPDSFQALMYEIAADSAMSAAYAAAKAR
ncbi:MAG TPA: hypothetical protein VF187_03455 [Gemmatimonadales bacterium]